MALDKSRNIMKDLTTTTEVKLISGDEVYSKYYGMNNTNLHIDNLYICNTSTTHPCIISLYLKRVSTVDEPKIESETVYDPEIHVSTYTLLTTDASETYSYHYFLKNLSIPLATSFQLENEIFKGIDFLYHDLCIIGDSNSQASITINIKH